nr:MAG TPA: hypothetical protein [Bacteriophage sp.]
MVDLSTHFSQKVEIFFVMSLERLMYQCFRHSKK